MAFIRLDDQEFAELERRAGEAGLSIGAYCRARTLGDAGPRARRRSPVDTTALMQGLAAFNRAHNNLNQATRALNTIALFAEEHGAERLVEMLDELNRALDRLDDEFAAPVAAILGALRDVREG